MHEVAISRSIYDIADRAREGRRLVSVAVEVGELRQVVSETLERCWGLVTRGTPLAGSRLDIETVPAWLECRACGERTRMGSLPIRVCGTCGSTATDVISGEDFLVRSIDLGE